MCAAGLRFAFPVHISLLLTREGESLPATPSVLQPCHLPRGHGNVLTLGVFSKHAQACRIYIVFPNSAPKVVESEAKGLQCLLFKAELKYYTSLGFIVGFVFFFTADLPLPNYLTLRAFLFFYFRFNFCHAYPCQAETHALGHHGFTPQGVVKPDVNTLLFSFSVLVRY